MLPKIDQPTYKITLPASKKDIIFRPFTVKENKFLIISLETEDPDEYSRAMKQIINNCCLTELDVDNLPFIDIEYFFLQLSAKSIGEVVETIYECNAEIDGVRCGNEMKVPINISETEIDNLHPDSGKIMITSTIGIQLKYPSFHNVIEFDVSDLNFIISCIDYIFDGTKIYYPKDVDKEDILGFIEGLNSQQFTIVEEFFQNPPSIVKRITHKCKKCGTEHQIKLEGYSDFFV